MTTKTTQSRTRKFLNGRIQVLEESANGFTHGGTVIIPRLLSETKFALEPNGNKQKDTSPDYFLFSPAVDDNTGETYWADAGAAWDKVAKETGMKFLSLSIDLADQKQRINVALFAADDEDQPKGWNKGDEPVVFSVNYTRPRAGNRGAGSAGSSGKAAAPLDF